MNSKNKGNTFERKISKILSERFYARTGIENSFRRNIDSGSFFGGSNVRRASTYDTSKATFGDIVCPEGFQFNLECKHYKSPPSFATVLKQELAQWNTWLDQARQDSIQAGLQMLVIIKYNGVDEFVFVAQPIPDTPVLFTYKDVFAYSLKTFLSQDDNVFFPNIAAI